MNDNNEFKGYTKELNQNGWVRVSGVFKEKEIEEISLFTHEFSMSEFESSENYDNALIDRLDNGSYLPRKIDWPYLKHQYFKEFIDNSNIKFILEKILGFRVCLLRDQVFMKPPGGGSAKPFHQDNAHYQCFPSEKVVAAWIALDHADEKNGCLEYLDGSHTLGLLEHTAVFGENFNVELKDKYILDSFPKSYGNVKKGDVLIHHSETFHRSGVNNSDSWRKGYATHWIGANVISKNDTLDWSYYRFDGDKVRRNHFDG